VITFACVLFRPIAVPKWSQCYSPEWVDKLYRGIRRNYHGRFRFVCFTDKPYDFAEPEIEQVALLWPELQWMTLLEPFRLSADRMLVMGLDTVITGDLSDIASYNGHIALCRDPSQPSRSCNAIVSVSRAASELLWHMFADRPEHWTAKCQYNGYPSEMLFLRDAVIDPDFFDDMCPGQVLSYKAHVCANHDSSNARVVYFHGSPKPPHLAPQHQWVVDAWR
jgi:hypothetical protein